MVNHSLAYTKITYFTIFIKISEGSRVEIYNLKIRLAVVKHLALWIRPGDLVENLSGAIPV